MQLDLFKPEKRWYVVRYELDGLLRKFELCGTDAIDAESRARDFVEKAGGTLRTIETRRRNNELKPERY